MLATYLSDHQAQLLQISNAQLCPFTCVGHVRYLRKTLLESCWVNAKNNNQKNNFELPTTEQLVEIITNTKNDELVAQACIEVMANLPQNKNIIFINELLNQPALSAFFKIIINKVVIQQHSFNLIRLLNLNTLFFAYSADDEIPPQTLVTINQITSLAQHHGPQILTAIFDALSEQAHLSPLMSLFLLSLNFEQVNSLSNHASNTLSVDQTLHILLQSGFVKLIVLANSLLQQVEQPALIIALIRRMLGDKLDQLVEYDIQRLAWQGDESALLEFQQQLKHNWSKYETAMSSLRLIAGHPLDEVPNAIYLSAMDSYSQGVFNLYRYYQHLAANKTQDEVAP